MKMTKKTEKNVNEKIIIARASARIM